MLAIIRIVNKNSFLSYTCEFGICNSSFFNDPYDDVFVILSKRSDESACSLVTSIFGSGPSVSLKSGTTVVGASNLYNGISIKLVIVADTQNIKINVTNVKTARTCPPSKIPINIILNACQF